MEFVLATIFLIILPGLMLWAQRSSQTERRERSVAALSALAEELGGELDLDALTLAHIKGPGAVNGSIRLHTSTEHAALSIHIFHPSFRALTLDAVATSTRVEVSEDELVNVALVKLTSSTSATLHGYELSAPLDELAALLFTSKRELLGDLTTPNYAPGTRLLARYTSNLSVDGGALALEWSFPRDLEHLDPTTLGHTLSAALELGEELTKATHGAAAPRLIELYDKHEGLTLTQRVELSDHILSECNSALSRAWRARVIEHEPPLRALAIIRDESFELASSRPNRRRALELSAALVHHNGHETNEGLSHVTPYTRRWLTSSLTGQHTPGELLTYELVERAIFDGFILAIAGWLEDGTLTKEALADMTPTLWHRFTGIGQAQLLASLPRPVRPRDRALLDLIEPRTLEPSLTAALFDFINALQLVDPMLVARDDVAVLLVYMIQRSPDEQLQHHAADRLAELGTPGALPAVKSLIDGRVDATPAQQGMGRRALTAIAARHGVDLSAGALTLSEDADKRGQLSVASSDGGLSIINKS